MPSAIKRITIAAFTGTQIFGYAKDRTSWTVYNQSANDVWWSNTSLRSGSSGFLIPTNTAFTLKIPEDDPMKETWLYCTVNSQVYVYEGFGGMGK